MAGSGGGLSGVGEAQLSQYLIMVVLLSGWTKRRNARPVVSMSKRQCPVEGAPSAGMRERGGEGGASSSLSIEK